ncbi:aminopeptidase, partial [candidate division WOR-3 bacterium]
MKDHRVERLADLLLRYSLGIKKNELLLIQASPPATPLIKELYKQALLLGAHPHTFITIEDLSEIFYKFARPHQLRYLSPIREFIVKKVDAFIWIMGSLNTRTLYGVDPARMAVTARSQEKLQRIFLKRERKGRLRWSGCLYPTYASAQDAEMSLDDYEEFVYRACYCNRRDPIGAWRRIEREQARLVRKLNRLKKLRIVTKGTDL